MLNGKFNRPTFIISLDTELIWGDPCTNIQKTPLYYGRDIVEKILSSPVRHELGYYSFSHVIFSECSREVAEVEIKEGIKLEKDMICGGT